MALKILSQNALDGFSDAATAEEFITLVDRVRPDVAIFPEAYEVADSAGVDAACARLAALGYDVSCGSYDDTDGRKDLHGLICLVRKDLTDPARSCRLTRLGSRNAAEGWLKDPATGRTVHFYGVHLNDRSEALRQKELDDLLGKVVADEPTVVMGDLNSLHHEDARGRQIWIARLFATLVRLKLWPISEPVNARRPKKGLGRIGSLSQRLTEMASGKTLQRLEAAGFTDADAQHRLTFPAKAPFAQLDHIMVSREITAKTCSVLPRGSSDHLGILAEID